jgi:hypothetical protein
MGTQIILSSPNYSGYIADITFYAQTGGTISLGSHLTPYTVDLDYYSGTYQLCYSAFNYCCEVLIIAPTPTPTPTIPALTPTPTVTPNYEFTELYFSARTGTGWESWNNWYKKVDNTSRYLINNTVTVCDNYLDRPYMLLSGSTGGYIGMSLNSDGSFFWNLFTTGTTSDNVAVCGNDRVIPLRLLLSTVGVTLINGINAPLQGIYLGTGLRQFSITWKDYPFNPQPVPTPSPTPTTMWYYYNVNISSTSCSYLSSNQIKTNRPLTIGKWYCYTPNGLSRIQIMSTATPSQLYTLQTCYTETNTCFDQPSPACFCP